MSFSVVRFSRQMCATHSIAPRANLQLREIADSTAFDVRAIGRHHFTKFLLVFQSRQGGLVPLLNQWSSELGIVWVSMGIYKIDEGLH